MTYGRPTGCDAAQACSSAVSSFAACRCCAMRRIPCWPKSGQQTTRSFTAGWILVSHRSDMQISTETDGAVLELRLQGRLDNEAADDLLAAVDDVLRNGHRAALVDMRHVDYVSSAGLGALVRAQKRFQELHGIIGIASSSPQVTEILQITKLAKILVCDPTEVRAKSAGATGTLVPSFRVAATDGLGLAIYDQSPAEKLRCSIWGDAQRLVAGRSDKQQVSQVRFPASAFGLGIGAFGHDEAECAGRFGEFMAASGG